MQIPVLKKMRSYAPASEKIWTTLSQLQGQNEIVYTAKFVWFTKDELILIIDFQTQDNFRP